MTLVTVGDAQRISIGCAYLLSGRAVLDYPGSTRARPSLDVVISLSPGRLLKESDRGYFPFKVPWDLWEEAVVPVLQDETYLRQSGETLSEWELRLLGGLLEKMQAGGFLHADPEDVLEIPVVPGEPVTRPPVTVGDPRFPVLDNELTWLDGQKREEYPIVN